MVTVLWDVAGICGIITKKNLINEGIMNPRRNL